MSTHITAGLKTRNHKPVLLQGVRVNGHLRGVLFEATVEQRFVNDTGRNAEVVYTFPLPWGAVLMDVAVRLGDQDLVGSVVEKKQAEARYEDALSAGDAAILLERNSDGSHSLNLGNLKAGEPCVIKLRYTQILSFEQQGLRLLIPTVIAPRYGDPVRDGGLQPHQVPEHDLTVSYPFDVRINVHGDLARARVSSPSHPVGIAAFQNGDEPQLSVSLTREGALDRDFILSIDQLDQTSLGVLAMDRIQPEKTAALLSFCPRISAETSEIAVKILVDCSGSMAGDSLSAAQRALICVLQQMDGADRFSLSRFGSSVEHRSRGLWRANETTRLTALRWVDHLQADLGGTEMEAALSSTFALARQTPSDVLLITDGEIEAIDSLISYAQSSNHRVFIVGIGSSPAEGHLRRLADATGGACDFVAPGEAVQPAIQRMFARLRSPRMESLRLEWPEGVKPIWVNTLSRTVFNGDTLNVHAQLATPVTGDVRLLGRRDENAPLEEIGRVQLNGVPDTGSTLAQLVAMQKLDVVSAPAALELALAYQLVSRHTHFLLVHERAEEDKPEDMPELQPVTHMLPAGWGGTGSIHPNRFSCSVECRINEYQADGGLGWDDGVFSNRSGPVAVSEPSDDTDYLDIPLFLRRQGGHAEEPTPIRTDVDDQGYITPYGLRQHLFQTVGESWPSSYDELRQVGLHPEIVDWLEFVFSGEYGAPLTERVVVDSFLQALLADEIHTAVMKPPGFLMQLRDKLGEALRKPLPMVPLTSDPELVEDLVSYLGGITMEYWPRNIHASGQGAMNKEELEYWEAVTESMD